VGLDVRPIGDARRIAQLLHARDVGLDPIEIDHHRRRAELARDLGLEGVGAHQRFPRFIGIRTMYLPDDGFGIGSPS
jgi:hypothetical protein